MQGMALHSCHISLPAAGYSLAGTETRTTYVTVSEDGKTEIISGACLCDFSSLCKFLAA
jgi:hypothetical protein